MVKKESEKEKSTVQAVLVADNFNLHLAPLLTNGKIWSSCPLANSHFIDYTLEWLSRTEVTDVIVVVAQKNFQSLEPIIRGWERRFECVTVVQCQNCMGVGDALREVDSRALIHTDFLLVQAPTFCAFDLKPQIDAYRTRKNKDKNNVMTLIYTQVDEAAEGDRAVLGLDTKSRRLTIYHRQHDSRKLDIDKSYFVASTEIRRDLRDSGVAICSPKISPLFSDNFDFQQRDDVIREILVNEEILCQNIHVEVLEPQCFAVAVKDFTSYLAASRFVLQRWSYPLVADGMSCIGNTRYKCGDRRIYTPVESDQAVTIDQNANVGPNVILGARCRVKDGASIRDVALGNSCHIGVGTTVRDTVLGSYCDVADDCVIEQSVIGDQVTIGSNCRIPPRCVLASKVTLMTDTVLSEGTVLCAQPPSDDDAFAFVPFQGGYKWTLKIGEFWSSAFGQQCLPNTSHTYDGHVTSESGDEVMQLNEWTDGDMGTSCGAEGENEGGAVMEGAGRFYEEIYDSLLRGHQESTSIKNLILEINSSKFAYNVPMEDVARLVMRAVLAVAAQSASDSHSLFKSLTSLFTEWKQLLANYYQPTQSQIQALLAIEDETLARPDLYGPCVGKLLHHLYEVDVLGEDAILQWFAKLQDNAIQILKPKIAKFIDWLQEAEEESD